jgi:hypothetical protein
VKLVPAFAGREWCMASALDPYGHYFWVSRPELLLLFMLFKKLYITQLSGVMEDVMLFQEVIWA